LDYFVFKKKNIRLIYNMSQVLLVDSLDVATLEIDQPRTRDAVDESKIFLLLSFNTKFAAIVNDMCKNTNPADFTLELFVVVNNVLSILDITPAVETYLLTNEDVLDSSRIKISIDNFDLGVTGFVEFHTLYNNNTYELYSPQLTVKHSTKPSKPVFPANQSFGTPDGTTIVVQPCLKNTAADGYSDITYLTVIWTEISTTSPQIEILRVPYKYDDNTYVFSNTANGTSLREGILYKVNVFYTNSVGRSLLSDQIQLRVGGLPNEVSSFEARMNSTRNAAGIATTTLDLVVQYPEGSADLGAFNNDDGALDTDTTITSFKIWAKTGSNDYSLLIQKSVSGNTTVTGNQISFKLSPTTLVEGTSYDIKVTAVSNLGEGVLADASVVSITYCGAAGKVTELTVTSSDVTPDILTLAWVQPAYLGGVLFSKYLIIAGSNSYESTSPTITIANSYSDSTYVAENPPLVSGTSFPVSVITVTVENGHSDFQGSRTDVIAYPSRRPTNPSSVSVESLDKSVKLSWPNDSDLFNLEFVKYSIIIDKEGNTVATHDITDPLTLEDTFNGLQNDGMYTVKFHVLTKNVLNNSQHSSNDDRTYNFWPYVKPSVPLNVTALTDLDNLPNINVTWDEPANVNTCGCAIQKYTIVRTCADEETTASIDVDDLIRAYVDTSGNPGNTYTYNVFATANNPNGEDSSAADVVGETSDGASRLAFVAPNPLAYDMLDAPIAGDTTITLSWELDPNAELCGLPTVGYKLREGSSSAVLATVLATSALTHTFSGLTNGTSYTYNISPYVFYQDTDVESPNNTQFAPCAPSIQPSTISDVAAFTKINDLPNITVSWTAPNLTGTGLTLESYNIYRLGSYWTNLISSNNSLEYIDTSVSNNLGTSFTYQVQPVFNNPVSGSFVGTTSNTSQQATAFVAPNPLASNMIEVPTASNTQITLNWSSDLNALVCGLPTVGYKLRELSSSEVVTVLATDPLTCTFTGLTNGTSYTYNISPYVVYTDDNGTYTIESEGSTSFNVSVPYTNPEPVTGLSCVSSTTSTSPSNALTWVLPTNTGGFPISRIQIYKSNTSSNADSTPVWIIPSLDTTATSWMDTNVTIGYNYTYSVEVTTTVVEVGLSDVQMNSTRASVSGIPSAPPVINSLTLNQEKNIVVNVTQNGSQVFNYLMLAVPTNATSTTDSQVINNGQPDPITTTNLTLDNAPVSFIIDAQAESFQELIVVVSNAVGMGFKAESLLVSSPA
jgi:hypothetical protein